MKENGYSANCSTRFGVAVSFVAFSVCSMGFTHGYSYSTLFRVIPLKSLKDLNMNSPW